MKNKTALRKKNIFNDKYHFQFALATCHCPSGNLFPSLKHTLWTPPPELVTSINNACIYSTDGTKDHMYMVPDQAGFCTIIAQPKSRNCIKS